MVRKGQMRGVEKGTSWGRSRSSRACFQWQPQLSKKRDFLPFMFPRELLQHKDDVLPTSKRMKMASCERAS